jgi:hypothetical protein
MSHFSDRDRRRIRRAAEAYRLEHGCAHQRVRPTPDGDLECLEGCGAVFTRDEWLDLIVLIGFDR